MGKIRWRETILSLSWKDGKVEQEPLPICYPSTLSLRQKFDVKEAVFRVKIYNNKTENLY